MNPNAKLIVGQQVYVNEVRRHFLMEYKIPESYWPATLMQPQPPLVGGPMNAAAMGMGVTGHPM